MSLPPYYTDVLKLKQLYQQCDIQKHDEIAQSIIRQAINNIKKDVPSTLVDIFYQHNCLSSSDIDTLINEMNELTIEKKIRTNTNVDMFSKLNQNIINNIGSFLNLAELPVLSQLNKNLNVYVYHDSFKFIRGVSFIKLITTINDINFDTALYSQQLHDCYDYWFNDKNNNDCLWILNSRSFDSFLRYKKPPPFLCGVAHKISMNYTKNDGTIKQQYTPIIQSTWFKGLFKCVYSLQLTAWSQILDIPIDTLFTHNQYNAGNAIKCIQLPTTNATYNTDTICEWFENQFKKVQLSRKGIRMIANMIVNVTSRNNGNNRRILGSLSGYYQRLFVRHGTLTIENNQTMSQIFHGNLVSLWLKNAASIRICAANCQPSINMNVGSLHEVVICNEQNDYKAFRRLMKMFTRFRLCNKSSTLTITEMNIVRPIPTDQTFATQLEPTFKECLKHLLLKTSIFEMITIKMDDNVFLDKFGQLLKFLCHNHTELNNLCKQETSHLCSVVIHLTKIVRPRTDNKCVTKMQMRWPWDKNYNTIHHFVKKQYTRTVNENDEQGYDSIANYDSIIDIDWEYDLLFDHIKQSVEIDFQTLNSMDKMAQLFKRTMLWFNEIDFMYNNLDDRCIILKMC